MARDLHDVLGRSLTTITVKAGLASARAVLAAAGITADLPQAVDDVDPRYREPFAYVLREGITNVVRHSGAQHCEVRMGPSWLEVRDDGSGGEPNGADIPAGHTEQKGATRREGSGHGLAGLRERLAPLGGTLEAGRLPGGVSGYGPAHDQGAGRG